MGEYTEKVEGISSHRQQHLPYKDIHMGVLLREAFKQQILLPPDVLGKGSKIEGDVGPKQFGAVGDSRLTDSVRTDLRLTQP
jgi:hypothetical protein